MHHATDRIAIVMSTAHILFVCKIAGMMNMVLQRLGHTYGGGLRDKLLQVAVYTIELSSADTFECVGLRSIVDDDGTNFRVLFFQNCLSKSQDPLALLESILLSS